MTDFVFNVAKGKGNEYCTRAIAGDPANAAIILMVLSATNLESDAILMDKVTFADIVSGTTREVTNAGYARKTIFGGSVTLAVDTVNDRQDADLPDQVFTAIGATPNWAKLVTGYDNDRTTGTDANIIPITAHDLIVSPIGTDITVQIAGFLRAA